MAHVAIVGAGFAGLATTLFLVRRGHKVTLIEADAATPPDDADTCFDHWRRHGVAQARQPHLILTRGSRILQQEAPEALGAFVAAGANLLTLQGQRVEPTEDSATFFVASRRLPIEAVFRRLVLASGSVEFLSGERVSALDARIGAGAPRVVGLRLDSGACLDADLVVDATGRFSRAAEWLETADGEPPHELRQDCNSFYLTGWYRKRPGRSLPQGQTPLSLNAGYAPFTCFPADGGVFALSVAGSMSDPCGARLRRPEIFQRVMDHIPEFAPWLEDADALGEPQMMARIENRWRALVKDARPLVLGFVLLGDSAIHTNPTLGRGVSLGLMQAERLATLLDTLEPGSADLALAFEQWRKDALGIWYETQVAAEAGRLNAAERALAGEEQQEPSTTADRFRAAFGLLASEDPVIFELSAKVMHLLVTPAELAASQDVRAAIAKRLELGGSLVAPLRGPTRAEFEALAG